MSDREPGFFRRIFRSKEKKERVERVTIWMKWQGGGEPLTFTGDVLKSSTMTPETVSRATEIAKHHNLAQLSLDFGRSSNKYTCYYGGDHAGGFELRPIITVPYNPTTPPRSPGMN